MIDFAYLDNQDIVLVTGNLQSLVNSGFRETTQSSYCFELEAKLSVKTIGNFYHVKAINSRTLRSVYYTDITVEILPFANLNFQVINMQFSKIKLIEYY